MALRVLLADNSETIKKVIQLTLQDFAIDLRIVTLGVDVLDVALQFKPDIIFVDILLQKKSGYEVSKELKNNVHLKSTPVVLMWSGFMEFDEPKAKESLADATLEKPFDADTLKNLVTKLVKKQDAPKDISSFLDFPTPGKAPTAAPKSAKHEDPLKSLEKIKHESEMFNPEKIKAPQAAELVNDLKAEDYTANNSAADENPVDEFEMQPLDKTTSFGYRKTNTPDQGVNPQTQSFILNLPDDMSGDDVSIELEKIENVEDMSFLLNPESVVGENPLKAEQKKSEEATRVIEHQTKITPPKTNIPPKMPTAAPAPQAMPAIPTIEDIERIVREEVRGALEKVVWQVVPELASQIIKKELDRLLNDDTTKKP